VSGQTSLEHGADTATVNGVLTSDGDVQAAAADEDAAVCFFHDLYSQNICRQEQNNS